MAEVSSCVLVFETLMVFGSGLVRVKEPRFEFGSVGEVWVMILFVH